MKDHRYPGPKVFFDEVRSLKQPWDELFTIEIGSYEPDAPVRKVKPGTNDWTDKVLIETPDLAVFSVTASVPDGLAAGSSSASGVTVIFLARNFGKDGEKSFGIVDMIVRTGSGYDGMTPGVLDGIGNAPLIHISNYSGVLRHGIHIQEFHSVRKSAEAKGGLEFVPSLAFENVYSQTGRDEDCRFAVVDGALQVTVKHEWMNHPEKEIVTKVVTLPFDSKTLTFDASPLRGLIAEEEDKPMGVLPGGI